MSRTFKLALVSGKVSINPARLVDAAISRPVMEDKNALAVIATRGRRNG